MNSLLKSWLAVFIIMLLVPIVGFADPEDPLARNRIIGNSAELMAIWPQRGDYFFAYAGIWDLVGEDLYGGDVSPAIIVNTDWSDKMVDITSGDFDGDGKDDIAMASVYESTAYLIIPQVYQSGSNFWMDNIISRQENEVYYGYESYYELGNLHIVSGNFDSDANKEVAMAFWDNATKKIEIKVYNISNLQSPIKSIENDDIYLEPLLREAATFDMATGDFDYDGIDEIIIAHGLYAASNDFRVAVRVFEVDMDGSQLISKAQVDTLYKYNPGAFTNNEGDYVERIAIATGNFNTADPGDEAVICFQYRIADWSDPGIWDPWGYYTKHYYYMQPIEISPDLNTIEYETSNRIYHFKDWHRHTTGTGPAYHHVSGFSMSVEAGDLDLDGREEIAWAVNDRFIGYTISNSLSLTEEFRIVRGVLWNDATSNSVLISDFNVDPNDEKWYPEIVLQDWIANAESRIRIFRPEFDYDGNFTGNLTPLDTVAGNNRHANQMAIAAGDLDGDAIRIGNPTYSQYTEFSQPTVILNPPPVHFDILNDTIFDINNAYNDNFLNSGFSSVYENIVTQSDEIVSEATTDWGLDLNLAYSTNYMGFGVRASMNAAYGEKFSKINANRKTVSIGSSTTARAKNCWIYSAETNYDIWEYPVYWNNGIEGHILVVNPYQVEGKWYSSDEWNDNKFIPRHEAGNIFSYPNYGNIEMEDEEVDTLIYSGNYTINQDSDFEWWLEMSTFSSQTLSSAYKVNLEVGASISGYGLEAGVGAHYGCGEIQTHTTTFNNDLKIWSFMGSIGSDYSAYYDMIPYTFWAPNGALVLDYCVRPHTAADNNGVPTFWETHYGTLPDPALIMPCRYHPEKDWTIDESLREKTFDISLNPQTPVPGSTIVITGRVHNFSMVDCVNDIDIAFYLNDPDFGGYMISPGVLTLTGGIDSRKSKVVYFDWTVPMEMPEHSRIYMILDPENEIEEIHENNNTGWKYVHTPGGTQTDVADDGENPIIPQNFGIAKIYPNPFNPVTNIRFSLEKKAEVTISVYNIIGQLVAEIGSGQYSPGYHEVTWNGTNDAGEEVASGLYFCRLWTEEKSDCKKIMLIK